MGFDRRGFFKILLAGSAAGAVAAKKLAAVEPHPAMTIPQERKAETQALPGWMKEELAKYMVDRRLTAWYDTLRRPAGWDLGRRPMGMFAYPLGQQEPYSREYRIKTYSDTNMHQAGMFNAPLDLLVDRIAFVFSADSPSGERLFRNGGSYEFRIMEKIMSRGRILTRDGVAVYDIQRLYIPPLVNFSLMLDCPNGGVLEEDLDLFVSLVGLTHFPVA